jgi:hypothetical protein
VHNLCPGSCSLTYITTTASAAARLLLLHLPLQEALLLLRPLTLAVRTLRTHVAGYKLALSVAFTLCFLPISNSNVCVICIISACACRQTQKPALAYRDTTMHTHTCCCFAIPYTHVLLPVHTLIGAELMPLYAGEVVLHASPYNYVLSLLDTIYNLLTCGIYDKVCLNSALAHKNSLVLTQSRIITVKSVRLSPHHSAHAAAHACTVAPLTAPGEPLLLLSRASFL